MWMHLAPSDPAVRRSVISLVLVLVLALVPAACGSSDDDDLAVASDLIEQYVAGWNDGDPDAIAAVFTEDGILTNQGDFQTNWYGREAIRGGAETSVLRVGDMESTGPVMMSDDGTLSCSFRFTMEGHGNTVVENEFEVEGGLISRLAGQVEFTEDGDSRN